MSKDMGKKHAGRRRRRQKKTVEGGAKSPSVASPAGIFSPGVSAMSMSGATSRVSDPSPSTLNAGQPALPGRIITRQPSSPGSVTTTEPASSGRGSGGHPYHGSPHTAAVTSTVSGAITAPKHDAMSPVLPSTSEPTAARNYHCALLLASCGFLAFVSFLVIISSFHKRSESHSALCNTEDCRAHASLLTKHLNWTLDPCEDFQAFVCSAVRSSSHRSEISKTVIDVVRLSWFQRLQAILVGGSLKIPVGRKALAMYSRCKDKYPSDKPDLPLFLKFIRDQGWDWPKPPREFEPPLQFAIKLAYVWQFPLWMSVSVLEVPDQSSSATRLRFQIRPSMLVPVLLYHHQVARPVYDTYWDLYLSHMYPDSSTRPNISRTAVDEIRDLEEQILRTLHSLANSASAKPAVFSFGNISAYVPNAFTFGWLRSFQESMPLSRQLSLADEIAVSNVRLLLLVGGLLETYNVRQLNMHLTWLLVQYYAPVADYRMLVDHYGSKQKAAAYLPLFCGHQVEASYKVLLAALDLVFRFNSRDIKTINDGFDDVVSTAVQKVNASDWIDDESKAQLTEKIFAVKKSLWPPDAVVNADLLEQLYGGFPENATSFAALWMSTRKNASVIMMKGQYQEVMRLPWNSLPGDVVYDYVSNTIELATGTISAPLYYPHGSKAMLYGGLLFLMATHLVRAFDKEGVRWTPNGSKVDSIMSNASLFEYHRRDRCLDGAVEHSLFPEVSAFEITYTAMKQSHVRDGSVPLVLPADLSEDEVFLMTLCYILCDISGRQPSRCPGCRRERGATAATASSHLKQGCEAFRQQGNAKAGGLSSTKSQGRHSRVAEDHSRRIRGVLRQQVTSAAVELAHGVTSEYFGKKIGTITTYNHGVAGNVSAAAEDGIFVMGLTYDGRGPDAYFWAGTKAELDEESGDQLPDEAGR
ncbi:endothelin-converting enzyme 2-like [Dermacentor silvarum]|uniref:endothelin-converting enzyme 2-like n=1 Tax=Dermacentor silvarum TaxID=543639 RepID=UPI0021013F47|nr:endothelin-converting enzyme 2-like [Dermacentor silvarum]